MIMSLTQSYCRCIFSRYFWYQTAFFGHLYALPMERYAFPNKWYYPQFLIKANKFWAKNKSSYMSYIIKPCTYSNIIFIPFQIAFMLGLLYIKYYFIAFLFECIVLLCLLFVVVYRIYKGWEYFYDYHDWNICVEEYMATQIDTISDVNNNSQNNNSNISKIESGNDDLTKLQNNDIGSI
eukprot:419297_1